MSFINWIVTWFMTVFDSAPVLAQIIVVGVGAIVGIAIFAGILWIAWKTFKWFGSKISSWPTWLKATTTIVVLIIMVIVLLVAMGKLWVGNTGSLTLDWKVDSCGGACSVAPSATPIVTVTVPTSTPSVAPSATPIVTVTVPTSTPTVAPSATPIVTVTVPTSTPSVAPSATPIASATIAPVGTPIGTGTP